MSECMGDPYTAQIRAAKAEGELARIKDELREFAEDNGFNPEMEPRDLLAKATGSFRSCAAMSDARYEEIRELKAEMEAMRPRLMPEDMEWPRYESGEPVRFGDVVSDVEVRSVVFRDGGILLSDCTSVPGWGTWHSYKEPIKRPAILAADGEPLEVGQTVWTLDNPIFECGVIGFGNGMVKLKCGPDHLLQREPSNLTHQRPVLDADGVPIREGDTVWCVATDEQLLDMNVSIVRGLNRGRELTVTDVTQRGGEPWARFEQTGFLIKTCYLTHAKPEQDSWERIEEDLGDEMAKQQCGPISPELACKLAGEFVRRCKELAVLKIAVLDIDPDDERGDLVTAVKRLQKRVREGKVI